MCYDYELLADNAKKFTKFLNVNGISASVKTSRYFSCIKAIEIKSPLSIGELLESVGVRGNVIDLTTKQEKSISGTYKAKYVILENGCDFFIVNIFTEKGHIKTKKLTPEKLGLTEKVYTEIEDFDKDVYRGIETLETFEENTILAIKELYKSVSDSCGDKIVYSPYLKQLMDNLKPQDRQAIGKDFGEIISLRWALNQNFSNNWTNFSFSTTSNEAIVDYYITLLDEKNVKVSAKFESGAAPSIKAIANSVGILYNSPTEEQKIAADVLKILTGIGENSNTTVSTKIINVSRILNLQSYNILQKILQNENPTTQDISNYIENIVKTNPSVDDRIRIFRESFSELFVVLKRNVAYETLEVVFSQNTFKNYYSLLISPMGYALSDYMNKTPILKEMLNEAARQLNIHQIYLYFKSNNIAIRVKNFSHSTFKFDYTSHAKN